MRLMRKIQTEHLFVQKVPGGIEITATGNFRTGEDHMILTPIAWADLYCIIQAMERYNQATNRDESYYHD